MIAKRFLSILKPTSLLCSAGVPNATYRLMQHQFLNRRSGQTPTPMDHLVPPVQCLTNPENWNTVLHSMHAVGVAALLSLTHPVLIPPLASTSAVAMSAVHGMFSVHMQRASLAANLLSQQALVQKRTPWSSVAVSVLGHKKRAVHEKRQNLGGLATVSTAVTMRMSQGAMHAHKVAKHIVASLTVVVDPLKPLRQRLSTQMATIAVPLCAVTVRDELVAPTTSQEPAAPPVRSMVIGGRLGRRQRIPAIATRRVNTGSSLRCRLQVGQCAGIYIGRNIK